MIFKNYVPVFPGKVPGFLVPDPVDIWFKPIKKGEIPIISNRQKFAQENLRFQSTGQTF